MLAQCVHDGLHGRIQVPVLILINTTTATTALCMHVTIAVQVLMASHMQSAKQVAKKVQTIMKQVDADGSGTLSYEVSVHTHLPCYLMFKSSEYSDLIYHHCYWAASSRSCMQDVRVCTVRLLTHLCMHGAL
jgi:hypothetical protein